MADLEKMKSALRNAHNAGDTAAAKKLANAIKAQQGEAVESPLQDYEKMSASENWVGQGLMMGGGDEVAAAIATPAGMVKQWWNGEDVSMSKAFNDAHDYQTKRLETYREENPVSSTVSEIGGAIMGGGGLGKAAVKMVPKAAQTFAKYSAPAVGAGVYGFNSSDGGFEQRAEDGVKSMIVGGALGAGVGVAGRQIGKYMGGRKVAQQMAKETPEIATLKAQESKLFETARQSGVRVQPKSSDKLINNLVFSAGRLNPNLRQKTAGVVEDLIAKKGQVLDVQDIHEVRQEIQRAMLNADASDANSLGNMMKVIDNFIDNADETMVSGGRQGLDMLRSGIELSSRRFKAERMAKLLDFADVKTGAYSQSGMVNALRSEASKLYTQIANGRVKGFTSEEIAIIRQLAKVETSKEATKWLSKFAPRGVVSIGVGSGIMGSLGFAAGGPAGGFIGASIPPAIGAVAARKADRAALAAAKGLKDKISRGPNYKMPPKVNRLTKSADKVMAPIGILGTMPQNR